MLKDRWDRIKEWDDFSLQVLMHIDQYAIPQYKSDNEEDNKINAENSERCIKAIDKYVKRFGKNARGPQEQLRDIIKIAHYAQMAYDAFKEEWEIDNLYRPRLISEAAIKALDSLKENETT